MFSEAPSIRTLPGERLHLSHGPIEVVLRAFGRPGAVRLAYDAVASRFAGFLPELCAELPLLRTRAGKDTTPESPVGRRMAAACAPFSDIFVTPMAAVAGSVADELLATMLSAADLDKAYVNNGGDIALHVAVGHVLDVGVAGDFGRGVRPGLNGSIRIDSKDAVGGIATSGRHGRSHSLGIADTVTVLAKDAATADVAATLIANAVDTGHPSIDRVPACDLAPDSDLGDRLVTVDVGLLPYDEIAKALVAGLRQARVYRDCGLVVDAALMLQGETVTLNETAMKTIAGRKAA